MVATLPEPYRTLEALSWRAGLVYVGVGLLPNNNRTTVKTEGAFSRVFRMYRVLHSQADMRRAHTQQYTAGSCGCAHWMHTALFICSSFGIKRAMKRALQPSAAGSVFLWHGALWQSKSQSFLRGALPRTPPGLAPCGPLFTRKHSQSLQLLGARPLACVFAQRTSENETVKSVYTQYI